MASALLDLPGRNQRSASGSPVSPPARAGGAWPRLRTSRSFWVGVAGIGLLSVAAILAPILAPADPAFAFRDGGLTAAGNPVGPSARFLFGTDLLGRDYFSRMLYGARISLVVGLIATLISVGLGTGIGMVAALSGTVRVGGVSLLGRRLQIALPVESILMRLTDAVLAFPAILLAAALVAIVGASLQVTIAVVAAFLWTGAARIVYARVRSLSGRQFVEASRALGVSPLRLATRHILPHVMPLVVAYAPIVFATAVLFEATLSYLGIGVPPPEPSWGSMIAEHSTFYASDPRLLLLPGGALVLTVLSLNLMADALRDALDPRLAAGSTTAVR